MLPQDLKFPTKMRSITDIKEGEKVQITQFRCERGIKHRLCSLGILNGQTVQVIKNDSHGPIIIKVLDSKIVLGRGQAEKIFVL